MIIVNLLPHHLRPIKRTPVPYLLSVGILLLCLAGIAYVFLDVQGQVRRTRLDHDARQAEMEQLADIVNQYNELKGKEVQLQTKIGVIKDILEDRIIWSEHLHKLASLTPDNIWYSRIRVTWQTFKEKSAKIDTKTGKPMLDPRTKQPQMEMKNVKRPVLEVSGYVINDEQGEAQIYPLTERTTDPAVDPEFVDQFTLLRPRVDFGEFNGFAVREFTLEYLIESGGTA